MWRRIRSSMRKPLGLLILGLPVLLFAVPCLAGVPDWVQMAAAKPQGTYPSDVNAVVLLDDTTLVVTGPGQADVTYRRVVRILRPKGRDEAAFGVYLSGGEKLQS